MNMCIIVASTMWLHLTGESLETVYVNVNNIAYVDQSGLVQLSGLRQPTSIRPWSEVTGTHMTGEEVMDMIRQCE
jgi:hypothetical protein